MIRTHTSPRFELSPDRARWTIPACAVVAWCLTPAVFGQLRSPSDRIDDLEREMATLQEELKELKEDAEKSKEKDEDEDFFAGGVLTLGGTKLRLGGKAELLFIATESDFFAPLGSDGFTAEPDPHLELQRLRLAPEWELNRWITLESQIDIHPVEGETILKELVARHEIEPTWWFESRFQVGVDDRFIRPARRTKNYPLTGTSFWRDESLAFTWRLSFGDPQGKPPEEEQGAQKKRSQRAVGTEGFDVSRAPRREKVPGPLDFLENWGQARLYLSLGQGYVLNNKEVGFDRARFNDMVQDDRELTTDLALRELGAGVSYRRDFGVLGDIELGGFYYDDRLRDASIQFLQGPDMTERNVLGQPVAGYGDSTSDRSYRYGARLDYFLSAERFLEDLLPNVRGQDGPRIALEYIVGEDGEMRREGWYVQGSWRVSFGKLLADRYFRSVEPLVRYGTYRVGVPLGPSPTLPSTWDRKALTLAGIIEVTGDIFLKVEYTIHDEETGDRPIDNDELLVELLLEF